MRLANRKTSNNYKSGVSISIGGIMREYVGVDVGKSELFIKSNKERFSIQNSTVAIKQKIDDFPELKEALWVFESTGGYERTLKKTLQSEAISYRQVHPTNVIMQSLWGF